MSTPSIGFVPNSNFQPSIRGIKNASCNCWLNSSFHLVADLPAFKTVFHQNQEKFGTLSKTIDQYKQDQLKLDKGRVSSINTSDLRRWTTQIVNFSPEDNVQEDATEFIQELLKNAGHTFTVEETIRLFTEEGKEISSTVRPEDRSVIILNFPPSPLDYPVLDFKTLLRNAFYEKNITVKKEKEKEKEDGGICIKTYSFPEPPNDLMINLARFKTSFRKIIPLSSPAPGSTASKVYDYVILQGLLITFAVFFGSAGCIWAITNGLKWLLLSLLSMGFGETANQCSSIPSPTESHVDSKPQVLYFRTKINSPVHMPLEFTLDRPYCSKETKYVCDGFISHIGSSCDSGHYVAYIREGNNWVYTSDETVIPCSLAKVRQEMQYGYLFHYQKV